ncbi:ATP-binding protein [Paenibacillus filicis]|uniref:histidine kinase n=1 Tax=Paenibacillus gyeongsangnamensis TaxID=3388067 RepID=A0ABT4QBI8_9BACL|nr:ATP-binding protein [Paenibacillus filicis]MCZ8514257.1 ATP-binding protein [Paenibacillus filicis]
MIFISLLFLTFSILFTYKKLNNISTRFMYGIIIGWILSFVSFTLYLSKFNYYYNIIYSFFNFSPGTWNYLVLTKFNPNLLIRMFNDGVILFQCSMLCFIVSLAQGPKPKAQRMFYSAVTFLFIFELIAYDPLFNIAWQNRMPFGLNFDIVDRTLRGIRFITIAIAFIILINDYLKYPKIKFIKNLTLLNILGLIPVIIIHILLFWWAPKNLVKATYLEGYYNYLQPPLGSNPMVLLILPYAVYLALTFMIAVIYKYNSIENYRKNKDIQIKKSIDTATLGARAFTHALKNHLLAIRSEAEYLKERHAQDKDSIYSLDLILQSCDSSMGSINEAADKLKNIQLNLQPHALDRPVKQALALLNPRESKIDIRMISGRVQSLAYMDLHHLAEAIFNLLENAMDSMAYQEDGIIKVETAEQNGWGIIRISDNGPGVLEEHLDSIFDPFFTTKSSVNNWGIGLSYCHKIVTGHDGKIQVESIIGQGTAFTIFLPLI